MRKVLFIIIWSISFSLLACEYIFGGAWWHGVTQRDVLCDCGHCKVGWCFMVSLTLCHLCTFQKFNFYLLLLILFSSASAAAADVVVVFSRVFINIFFLLLDFVFLLCITLPFTNPLTTIFPCLYYVILAVPNFFFSLLRLLRSSLCFLAAFLSFFISSTVNRAEHVSLDKTYFVFLLFRSFIWIISSVCVCGPQFTPQRHLANILSPSKEEQKMYRKIYMFILNKQVPNWPRHER